MLRVTLSGVESVGKSTLAEKLARHFGGLLVPEFGRTYTEQLRRNLALEDHYAIAEGHEISAEQAASAHPPVLVEDTDIVMTTAWATMLFGGRDAILASRQSPAHLHLLLMPDVPFVADKVRMFGDDAERLRFHAIVVEEFAARDTPYVAVQGGWEDRWNMALSAITERL